MNWYVCVAEHRRDELAENELIARGFDVHVPRKWSRERTHRGQMRMGYDLTHFPYFYVQFDGIDKDEYALAKSQRGVSHFLEIKPEMPGIVPDTLIHDHRERERAERANVRAPKARGRLDLTLHAEYLIRSGLMNGQIGKLADFGRGRAYLDVGGIRVDVPDFDIAIVTAERKRA